MRNEEGNLQNLESSGGGESLDHSRGRCRSLKRVVMMVSSDPEDIEVRAKKKNGRLDQSSVWSDGVQSVTSLIVAFLS
ncbi:hypothetical protein L1987_35196 [Smallanthus sonchifolius]|uniref:Uncharacterized protein n=1 Tax=Smallanthus sonchifolius TaxID=185202 RepID=A0ACB9HX59_9ASTR|nr:hypothetical protein L1987_35196 [Smallanthus sonchifolius]